MLTWEYPPYKVGGIATHCYDLSRFLVRKGHDVHIVTYGEKEKEEYDKGITIHRVPGVRSIDTASWATAITHKIEQKVIELHKLYGFELVHAHDWMMVPSGVGIKKLLGLPMVFTLHSTEHGRSGVHDSYTKFINDLEWYGCYEADQVITVGKDFYNEVKTLFSVPDDKINYIPNGLDVERFDRHVVSIGRDQLAGDWERICLFVGRHSHQKGIEYLLLSIPSILQTHPDIKFVFAGGGAVDYYRNLARLLGIHNKTYFLGYTSDDMIISLFKLADMVAIPSVYEPFGIVALEAGAAKKAAVASYTGGLKEIILHENTGLHTFPADPESIANQTKRILADNSWNKWMGKNARKRVESKYTWSKIADWTIGVYGKALQIW